MTLLLALLTFAAAHATPTENCGEDLRAPSLARSLRAELHVASDTYAHKHPEAAISLLRGNEASQLPLYDKGQMVYLASGADIYRPLYDFPLLENYHLVDALTGWGASPQNMIDEVVRRLSEIAPGATVNMLERGFLDDISPEMLAHRYEGQGQRDFIGQVLGHDGALKPLILQVEWTSPGAGPQSKKIYLHAVDFHNPITMKSVLESLDSEQALVGILEAGYGALPYETVFHNLMERLSGDGHFIFEEWDTIGFSASHAIEAARNLIGPAYDIRLALPPTEIQEEMAKTDPQQKRRITFEYLFTKPAP